MLLATLAGCGIAAKVNAREEYQRSLASYKSCLIANPNNAEACNNQRLIMEADEHAYIDFAAGIAHANNQIISVHTQSR